MATLIVKNRKTGLERPMSERSFELAGKKRGFEIIGRVEQPKTEMQLLKEKLIAEKTSKEAENVSHETNTQDEPKKRGPKPKQQSNEV